MQLKNWQQMSKLIFDLTAHAISQIPDKDRTKVLFLFSVRDGRLMVGGKNSHAAAIIEMAGGINLMQSIEGYKMVDDEALLTNPPDVILMNEVPSRCRQAMKIWQLFRLLAHSPAIKHSRIIRMDGMYLLGFGPRTAQGRQGFGQATLSRQ